MSLIEVLESGRRDVFDAVEGLTETASLAKPSPDRWSVLECLEHVVIVEERFQGWLENGSAISPIPRPENESRIFNLVTDRSSKATAPEAVVPSGRFRALKEGLLAFNAVRDRSVNIVKGRGEDLYTIGAQHARFGELNGVEVIHLIAGHARRHAAQIREMRDGARG